MKKREIGNLFLHIAVGAALAALVLWHVWFIIPVTFIYAFLREQAQHRWIITGPMEHLSYPAYHVEKRTFFDFGWLTWHRIWEVFQWVLGAAVVCLGYQIIFV